jgi:predicted dehydrogenase
MVTRPLRIGVIGVGRQGERHSRVYSSLAGVHFVGVSDLSIDRGSAVAARHGVEFYRDHAALLEQVDAVSIATPTASHVELVAECVARRVHVLVEKPLASDLSEARRMVQLAAQTRTIVQVGHIERFNPAFLELQSVLQDLAVIAVHARRLSPFDTSNTDTDVVLDLMIHDLDLVLTLFGGDIASVQAHARAARTEVPDYVVATLMLARGPVATLTASRVTEHKVRLLEITALDAYVEADLLGKTISIYRRTMPEYLTNHQRPLRYRQENVVERIYIPTAEPLFLQLQDFIRCAREGDQPKVTVQDGLRVMALAARIREQFVPAVAEVPALLAV